MKIGMRANRPFIITDEQHGQTVLNAKTVLEALHMPAADRNLARLKRLRRKN